jgi:hypothetical protein
LKKQLLCTSAIAFGVAAAPAAAQEWSVDVGGYYNFYTGFSDVDVATGAPNAAGDFGGLQINKDSEIYISPSIDLDNGMTFGVDFQLETADGADMDEVYMYAESDTFGRLEAGSHNSAGYLMSVGAPSAGGLPINSGSVSAFVPFGTSGGTIVNSFVSAGYSSYIEVGNGILGGNSDNPRITYFSPDFNGFTFGFSYAPGTTPGGDGQTALINSNADPMTDIVDIGLNYSQSFKNTDITLSARYGTADGNVNNTFGGTPIASVEDPEAYALGAQVGFGAITVGGSYQKNDNGLALNAGGPNPVNSVTDEEGFTLGATYDLTGPWTVGLEYLHGEGDHGDGNGEDELDIIKLAGSRNLGPGVTWGVSLTSTTVDAADTATGGLLGGVNGDDVEALTASTSLKFAF